MNHWLGALISFCVNVVLLFLYLKVSHQKHWFDQPDEERKLHSMAKPTSAGLIFMLPLVTLLYFSPLDDFLNFQLIAVLLSILLIVGGIDDFKSISATFRLIVITCVSVCLIYLVSKSLDRNLVVFGIYLLGLIWWMNLYNFMDGADGMTALHAIVVLIGYGLAFWMDSENFSDLLTYEMVFLACMMSFLIFNFPKSKVFMGDAGSLSVAFVIAIFAFFGLMMDVFDETLIISFHLVFIIDTTFTLFARMKFKHQLSKAHNLHVFQALIKNGWSHAQVSCLYASVTAIMVLVSLLMKYVEADLWLKTFILLLQVMVLGTLWVLFHSKSKFSAFIQ